MLSVVSSTVGRLCRRFLVPAVLALLPSAFATDHPVTASSPENINFANVALQPGDRIVLEAHTRSKLVLENITQGTPENPIVITNVGGQFIIDNTTGDKGLHFYNCRNIVVRGTPSPGNYDYGIKIARVSVSNGIGMAFIQGSTDFEVTNVEIANTGFAGLMAKSDNLKGSSGFVMRNVRIHGLYIHDVGAEGIYVGSSFYHVTDPANPNYDPHEIHNVQIYNNRIENAGWDGIQLGCATQGVNAIHDNTIKGYGILAGADVQQDEGIRSNPGTAADIYNNWIEGSVSNSGTAIFANPYNSVKYYNNVIVTPQEIGILAGETTAARGYVAGYSVKVFNNTIIGPKTYGVRLDNLLHASGNILQNTLVVAPETDDILLNNATATEAGNLHVMAIEDAGFSNPGAADYRLTTLSPARDAGVDLAALGLADDFAGVTRPVGAGFDVGAYEYAAFGAGAPVISKHPSAQLVVAGNTASFVVEATGDAPLSHQWRKNGQPIAGATAATLSLPTIQTADAAAYSVTIANAGGSVTSRTASLMVVTVLPPVITTHPASQTVVEGGGASFTVAASGTGPFSYQWLKDGVPVSGSTAATLTLANVQASDAGAYTVTVSNAGGAVTSNAATLTVNPPPSTPAVFTAATIVSDATVAGPVNTTNNYTHAINIGASATVTVNGVAFSFGTGNGGGAQPAKNYTFTTFNNTSATFASTATGDIRTLLATRSTNTNSASYALTLSGLTPGRRYGFALFTDSAHGVGRNWYRVSQNTDAVTHDVDFSAGGANSSRMLAATYTATASAVTFTFTRLDGVGTTNSTGWVGFAGFVNYELALPPQITTPPAGRSMAAGADATFAVVATGSGPLTYQWLKDGQPIAGATGTALTLHNVQPPDAGNYSVVVTNPGGSVTSSPAVLSVHGTLFTAGTIVSDATVAAHLNPAFAYTHAIDINASSAVTVNGVTFGFGTGNGGGAQPAKGYTVTSFNNTVTNFNSTATGQIRPVLATRATNTNSATYALTLSSLTPGINYTFALFTDSGHGPGRNWYRLTSDADPLTYEVDFSAGGVNSSRVTTVTYTPAATTVTFTFTRLDGMGSPGVTNSTSWIGFAGFVNYALPAAPTIVIPPSSKSVDEGSDVVFAVAARGEAPLSYQWLRNGSAITGATSSSLVLTNVTAAQTGAYAVTVTNPSGAVTSGDATLTVNALVAPVLTTVPASRSVEVGAATTFVAAATGTAPLSYQWSKDGASIAGATAASLALTNVQLADAGGYTVTVTNPVSFVTSTPAVLTVTTPPPVAPTITTQPANRTTDLNLSATFTVVATGTAPIAYQWSKDGSVIAGATSASLVLSTVQPDDAGQYTVTVSNAQGSVTSVPATLTVNIPRQTAQRATVAGQFDLNYLLFLPTDYAPDSGPEWPLLVFLHGYGERSTPEANPMDPVHLNKLKVSGPPKRIEEGTEFPFIVVSPQCATDWWNGAQLEQFITELQRRYRIDRSRIMLTGLSMGGFGVFDLAQRNPSRYAAIAPMSASPQLDAGNLAAAPRLRDLPLWAFHGASDPLYSVTDLQNYLDVIRAAGGDPKLTVYTTSPGNGHNAWVPAYYNDELYTWLLTQSAQPPTITLSPQATSVVLGGSVTLSVTVSGRWPFSYQWTKDGAPIAGATAETLTLSNAQFPTAGEYAVAITNGVGTTTSTSVGVTVTKIPATVALQNLVQTYDGLPKPVGVTTEPAGLSVVINYDGGTAVPVNAGTYAVAAEIDDPNYTGTASGTLEIGRATPSLAWNPPAAITYGTPLGSTQLNATAGVPGSFVYFPAAGSILPAGAARQLTVTFFPLDAVNFNQASTTTTITVDPASASPILSGLTRAHDGQPKPVTVTTTPTGLAVRVTYNGSATPPSLPGDYAVVAMVDDPNYRGSAESRLTIAAAALVRHAPLLNGGVDGSVQFLLGESMTFNGNASVSGHLLAPGFPTLQLNGYPVLGGTSDNSGAATPANYTITLNGGAVLGRLARRTDPIPLPTVSAPTAPTGTANVVLNSPGQVVANWLAVRNLTLNSSVGQVAVPPGAYGVLTANAGSAFLLGISGASEPAVYDLQSLVLNTGAELRLAGPVMLTLAGGVSLNGPAGSADHPDWLTLRLHAGGLTLNDHASLRGNVIVPAGTVSINGDSTLTGTVRADRLIINGNGLLSQPPDGN